MYKENKGTFTKIFRNEMFRVVIKKLTIGETLEGHEKAYILSCAILFLGEYVKDKRYISYADFAYYIILKYSITYKDYDPLYDFPINIGFYPISKIISDNNLILKNNINNFLIDYNVENFFNGIIMRHFNSKKKKQGF